MNRFSCSTIRSISKFSDYFLGRFHQVFSFVEGIFLLGHFICWVAYYTHYTGWILGILIIFIISIMVHYNSYILGAYNPLLDLYSLNNQGLGFFFIAHISGGLVCVCVCAKRAANWCTQILLELSMSICPDVRVTVCVCVQVLRRVCHQRHAQALKIEPNAWAKKLWSTPLVRGPSFGRWGHGQNNHSKLQSPAHLSARKESMSFESLTNGD